MTIQDANAPAEGVTGASGNITLLGHYTDLAGIKSFVVNGINYSHTAFQAYVADIINPIYASPNIV